MHKCSLSMGCHSLLSCVVLIAIMCVLVVPAPLREYVAKLDEDEAKSSDPTYVLVKVYCPAVATSVNPVKATTGGFTFRGLVLCCVVLCVCVCLCVCVDRFSACA